MDIKLILVVENRIYSEGICHFLMQEHDIDVQSIYSNSETARKNIIAGRADVIVMDYRMTNSMTMLEDIKEHKPNLKVVMLTYNIDAELVSTCAFAGVEGVITNNDSMADLKQCILSVYSGHLCYPANSYAVVQQSSSPITVDFEQESTLTLRQTKVMRLVEQGYSNKEIARTLNIELCTVKNHVHHILDKLQVKNRCEAASVFRRAVGQHA